MSSRPEEDENTVMQFIYDFFSTYDKNRHMLHTLFQPDGTYIVLGNRITGHQAIQHAMCTMANTNHDVITMDIQLVPLNLGENIFMYQALCAGSVEMGGDPQLHSYTATLLICFRKPNMLNVISFDERLMWAKLA